MYNDSHAKYISGMKYTVHNITDYVNTFIKDIRQKEGRVFKMNSSAEVMYMKEFLNKPENTTSKSMFNPVTGRCYWDRQLVDCVPSNLGRGHGHLFYFRCNSCSKRAKFLYELSPTESPLCRRCSRIPYRTPSRKERGLSRLLRKPYFSSADKYLIVKRAGITREEMQSFLKEM